jgi:uncharacterized protein YqeY
MNDLSARLQTDLKEAVRSGDRTRRDVIRFLRADIHNVEIERGHALSDGEITDVIMRQIKQRRDSIEQFARGGRQDLVDAEQGQIAVLETYLPPQLTPSEVLEFAREVVAESGASGLGDLGRVIPMLRERLGPRAAGNVVAQAARTALTEQRDEANAS